MKSYRTPRNGGILEALYKDINENLPEGEKVESLGCEIKMDKGDGRWRTLDGKYSKKEGKK
ncbi:MAG: hypothetical protein FWH42_01455 [Dehalococcoidia bacterium]|nr:hypothetical protein [Dehalococcoidia bacterium]